MDKINQLSLGEKLVAGGGLLMFIVGFFPWYKYSFNFEGIASGSVSYNGWENPGSLWSILAIIVSVVLAGTIIGAKFGNLKLPALGGFSWGQAYLAGGAFVVLMLLIKLINESSYLAIGFYLAILCAAAVAAGGYLLFSEDKGSGFAMPKK